MSPYVIWYYCDCIFSTLLGYFTCFLILNKSPADMKTFKWILLNIQISAYLETMFLALPFQPTIEIEPLLNFAPHGFAFSLFKIPTPTLFAISILLHGAIDGSLAVGLFYRYWILLTLIGVRLPWIGAAIMPFIQYVFAGGGCFICCYFSFFDIDSSRKIILSKNPNATIHGGAITFGGPGTIPWAITIILAMVTAIFCINFIIVHSNLILKKSSTSLRTKYMHRSAMKSLIIQLSASFLCSLVPTACCAYQLLVGVEDGAIPVCLPYFSMKTISCSLACIFTTKPYKPVY